MTSLNLKKIIKIFKNHFIIVYLRSYKILFVKYFLSFFFNG